MTTTLHAAVEPGITVRIARAQALSATNAKPTCHENPKCARPKRSHLIPLVTAFDVIVDARRFQDVTMAYPERLLVYRGIPRG